MRKFKQILCVAAAAAILLTALSGCGKDKGGSSGSDGSSTAAVTVNFATEGYSIVRPADNNEMATLGASVFKAIKESTGEKLNNVDDTAGINEKGEIIIGKTTRPQSEKAIELLKTAATGRMAEYIICYIDGAVVINGMSDYAIKNGVDKFISDYCKTCEIKTDECNAFNAKGDYTDIMLNGENLGNYSIVMPKYNTSYLTMVEIEAMRKAVLDATGFSLEVKKDDAAVTGREIVIGAAKRDGGETELGRDDYTIKTVGEKVFINGGRNYSLSHAVKVFADKLMSGGNAAETVSGSFDGKSASRDYKLIWNDEFDSLDIKDKWEARSELQNKFGNWYGMGTARSTDLKNLYTKDGSLYITPSYDTNNFYGVFMTTKYSLKFTYGYIEMSARLADGDGLWHDLWTWSDDKEHIEFDIVECWGPGTAYVSVIHEFTYPDGVKQKDDNVIEQRIASNGKVISDYSEWKQYRRNKDSLSFHDDFHNFACEWTEEKVVFYLDGVETATYVYKDTNTAYLYEKPHYLILSMLVGSNKANHTPDEEVVINRDIAILNPKLDADYWTNGDGQFIVDYVQVFQKDGQVAYIG